MKYTRLRAAAAIIAVIILGSFVFSLPNTRTNVPALLNSFTEEKKEVPVPVVALRDVFRRGVHTITGSVLAPNACTKLNVETTLVGSASSTQNILVAISLPEDSGICLQRESLLKFSTTVTAPAGLPIVTTVNSVTATTTAL